MDNNNIARKRFSLGKICQTASIAEAAWKNDEFSLEIMVSLLRHITGDYSEMSEDDIKSNDEAIRSGGRILSAYDTSQGKIWIITEGDRSSTTVLYPDEY